MSTSIYTWRDNYSIIFYSFVTHDFSIGFSNEWKESLVSNRKIEIDNNFLEIWNAYKLQLNICTLIKSYAASFFGDKERLLLVSWHMRVKLGRTSRPVPA